MKKFKINETTTLEDVEGELNRMYSANVIEFELSDIIKIAEFLGCKYHGGCGGSQVRFSHPAVDTYNHFFGVHLVHGKKIELVNKANFKKYVYPSLMNIIENLKGK
jgi:hypothetical protein